VSTCSEITKSSIDQSRNLILFLKDSRALPVDHENGWLIQRSILLEVITPGNIGDKTTFKWEQIYAEGNQQNRYPFDVVVSTVFSLFKGIKDRSEIHVLDLGCGCGNNTWFLCAEGFTVTAIDGSPTALKIAEERLKETGYGQRCKFIRQFFEELVLPEKVFDLVIDRLSVSQTPPGIIESVYSKVFHALKPRGYFFSQLFSEASTDRLKGHKMPDGSYDDFSAGYFVNIGRTTFLNRQNIEELFSSFEVLSLSHVAETNLITGDREAVWNVLASRS